MSPGMLAMGLALGRWAGMDEQQVLHGPWAWVLERAWARGVLEGGVYVPSGPGVREQLEKLTNRPWQHH